MTDTPTGGGRAHLARRSYRATTTSAQAGLVMRCKCGNWTSEDHPSLIKVREIEDAHRAHRVAMGETVKERKPSQPDLLRAAYRQIEELKAKLAAYENRENNA